MKNYLRLLKFLKPQAPLFFIAFICTNISALLDGITLLSLLPFVDIVFTHKKIVIPTSLPSFVSGFIDKVNSIEPRALLNILLLCILPFFLLKGLFFWLQGYLMNTVAYHTVREVRNKLFRKIQSFSLSFYSQKRTGELMSRIVNDVSYLTNAISFAFKDLIHESLRLLIYVFFAFSIGGRISLMTFLLLPLIIWPAAKIGKKLKKISLHTQEKMADINSLLSETISGVRIVKAFSMEEYEAKRFEKENRQYFHYLLKAAKRSLLSSPLSEFVGAIAVTAILFLWARELMEGNISFGSFGVVMGSLLSTMQPLKKLTGVHFVTQEGLAASKRIYKILDEEVSIKEEPFAVIAPCLKNKIAFENVWFRYEEAGDYVLKGINLDIHKGQSIALIGPSGSGKTTLANLIPRFYDPQKGRVLFDGLDIKKCALKSLRALIGMVTQEMVLFNDTIRANIAYGNLSASFQKLEEAAAKALARDFILKLPQQYETVIGERGFKLSGGEKQRIAIARAILKNAPILILDEATSQLDSESEQLIKEAFYNLMEGKTVFVIAHRLSTIQKADRIVVLEKGEIKEEGNHFSLISRNTLYKKLYELQFNV